MYRNVQNYDVIYFVWVRNLIFYAQRRTQIASLEEQSAEENIWT
jgi:hypothetical protein